MANYGLARKFDIFDFETGETSAVIARPSAWYQAALYEDSHKDDDVPDAVSGTLGVYVWAYFAIKCAGLLDKYGLPDEIAPESVLGMMDRYAVSVGAIGEGDVPLASRRAI